MRTEEEKERLAKVFLERRGYVVCRNLISIGKVTEMLGGVSNTHILNLIEKEGFPQPYNFGTGRIKPLRKWNASDVEAWIETRMAHENQRRVTE